LIREKKKLREKKGKVDGKVREKWDRGKKKRGIRGGLKG